MDQKTVLLICGGGGTEHEISLTSSKFLKDQISKIPGLKTYIIEIKADGERVDENGQKVELRKGGYIYHHSTDVTEQLHFAIPCFHGPPGETGEIQSVFEMMKLPYLGCGPEASLLCFNKVSTKLWMDAANIPNTPWTFLTDMDEMQKAHDFFKSSNGVFVKAASQGSSVGCYKVEKESELEKSITEAFKYSSYVIVEKMVSGRELEVSAYEHKGELHISDPGEIICPDKFYSYEEKYSNDSKTETVMKAEGLDSNTLQKIKESSRKAFQLFKLRHLSRIDYFLTDDGEVYLNEINTFPGMTPISMFPKMMEADGVEFKSFLEEIISKNARANS